MGLKNLFYSFMLLSLSIAFVACNDSDSYNPDDYIEKEDPNKARPTQDVLEVSSSLETYIFQHPYTEVAERLIARMKNQSSALTPNVKTVILHNKHIDQLSSEQYKTLLQIYLQYGNLVIVEPEIPTWNRFITQLVGSLDLLSAKECPKNLRARIGTLEQAVSSFATRQNPQPNETIYVSNNGENSLDEHFFDMIILRDNDVYYVDDVLDPDAPQQVSCFHYVGESTEQTPEEVLVDFEADYNSYDFGKQADLICQQLNEQPHHAEHKASLLAKGKSLLASSNGGNLADLMSAQRQRFQYKYHHPYFKGQGNCEVIYDVWAVNDLSSHEDIYLIHQEVDLNNRTLNCGPEDIYKFYVVQGAKAQKYFKQDVYYLYGAYMKGFEVRTEMAGADCNSGYFRDIQPKTTVGSSSVTSGFSWNIGGSLGLSASGVNGSVSGGVSFSESYTSNIPDLAINLNEEIPKVWWNNTSTEVQIVRPTVFHNIRHEIAKPIQINLCSVNNTFIWMQPNARDEYEINYSSTITVEGVGCYPAPDLWLYKSRFTRNSHSSLNMKLTPPNRIVFNCKMKCIADGQGMGETELYDYLEKNYSNIGWKTDLGLCSPDRNVQRESLAQEYLAKIMPKIRKDRDLWINEGKGGLYRVYITDENNDRIATETLDFRK